MKPVLWNFIQKKRMYDVSWSKELVNIGIIRMKKN